MNYIGILLLIVCILMHTINYSASVGATIADAGTNIYAADFIFNPTDSNDTALTVAVSNVTIDLQGHVFSQKSGNTTSGFNGIVVNANLSNIIIKNGMIKNITGKGIVINAGCSNITIDNVTTLSCDTRGIDIVGTGVNPVIDSRMSNCSFIQCCQGLTTGDYVLSIANGTRVVVEHCFFNKNGIVNHDLQVVHLDTCIKCIHTDIFAIDNVGANFRGFDLSATTDCFFKGCVLKNNSGTTNARGFMLASSANSDNNEFIDCSALQLSGAASVDGFLIESTCDDNLLVQCKAMYNSATGSNASAIVHGFFIKSSSRNTCERCVASKNTASSSTATFGSLGFEVNAGTNCVLVSCRAVANSGGTTPAGINIDAGSGGVIEDCLSTNNNIGFRVDPANSTSHAFARNRSFKNTTNYSGFVLGSTQLATDIAGINASLLSPLSNAGIG